MFARPGFRGAESAVTHKLTAPLSYDPTWAAPAASLQSHHGYPGGWALHNALNLQGLHALLAQARSTKGMRIDPDPLFDGTGWRRIEAPVIRGKKAFALLATTDGGIIVGQNVGRLVRGDPSGTWTRVLNAGSGVFHVLADTGDVLWAASGAGVYRSFDSGFTWEPFLPEGMPERVRWTAAAGNDGLHLVSKDGVVARIADGTVSEHRIDANPSDAVLDDRGRLWIVGGAGKHGRVFRIDPDSNPVEIPVAGIPELHAVMFSEETGVLAAGRDGVIVQLTAPGSPALD